MHWKELENQARVFFAEKGIVLKEGKGVDVGIEQTKNHKFDLESLDKRVLVECKAHTWTKGKNIPSAKMAIWDQAMYLFHVSPKGVRKILFVLKDWSQERGKTLAKYYIETNSHLIPKNVEIWEYDEKKKTAKQLR